MSPYMVQKIMKEKKSILSEKFVEISSVLLFFQPFRWNKFLCFLYLVKMSKFFRFGMGFVWWWLTERNFFFILFQFGWFIFICCAIKSEFLVWILLVANLTVLWKFKYFSKGRKLRLNVEIQLIIMKFFSKNLS